ncbi:hypothetical protein QQ045_002158 [Rhodiola kirilowii]
MAGFNTFTLFIILGLILFVSTSQTARNPFITTASSVTPSEVNKSVTHTLTSKSSPLTKDGEEGMLEEDDECSGLEMECLRRRSMVAHTDYIYTQDINNGP